jgi:hypothetical protein
LQWQLARCIDERGGNKKVPVVTSFAGDAICTIYFALDAKADIENTSKSLPDVATRRTSDATPILPPMFR